MAGYWPLAFDLTDYAGLSRHALPALASSANTYDTSASYRLSTVAGRPGHAFNGGHLLTCGSNPEDFVFDYETPFSVSVWFCRTFDAAATNTPVPLVSKTESSGFVSRGWDVSLIPYERPMDEGGNGSSTGYGVQIQFRIMGYQPFSYGLAVAATLESDSAWGLFQWHHLLVTYDGDLSAEGMCVYLDGHPQNLSILYDLPVVDPASHVNNLWLGGACYVSGDPSVATGVALGTTRIWDRELLPNAAVDIYQREQYAVTKQALVVKSLPAQSWTDLYLCVADARNASTTLFIAAGQQEEDTLTLTVTGGPTYNSMPLFLGAGSTAESVPALPLVIVGGANSNQIPLFTSGGITQALSAPLYIFGLGVNQHGLPLVCKAQTIPSHSLLANLFVRGSGQPNAVHWANLFIEGGKWSENRQMVLFLQGSPTDRTVRNMNLWLNAVLPHAQGSTTLYLHNDLQGSSDSIPLFLKVDGELVGGQAAHSQMILFLKRPPENAISLYMHGPGTVATSPLLSLLVEGALPFNQSVTLVIPKTVGVITPKVTLYSHGF